MEYSAAGKVWRIIYPPLLLYGILLLVYGIVMLMYDSFFAGSYTDIDAFMNEWDRAVNIAGLLAGAGVCYRFYKRDLVQTSDFLKEHKAYIPAVIALGVFFGQAFSIIISLLNIDGLIGSYSEVSETIFSASPVLVVLNSCIVVPVAEELVFRGLVFNRAKSALGFLPAAIISSAYFGVYHMNLAQGLYAFLFAMTICMVYDKVKNLWAPILMHAAANTVAVILEYTGSPLSAVWQYIIEAVILLVISVFLYKKMFSRIDRQ